MSFEKTLHQKLEKFSFFRLGYTILVGILSLVVSISPIAALITLPLWPFSGLLYFVTNHYGSLSDMGIVFYLIFIFFWASKFPWWSTRVMFVFGLFAPCVAMVYFDLGFSNGINNHIFYFMYEYRTKETPVVWALLLFVYVFYIVALTITAKKGHKVYLAKCKAQDEQNVIEAAKFKTCPHCAETILTEAKVCKHCGRDI